jgi:hypothetical protein
MRLAGHRLQAQRVSEVPDASQEVFTLGEFLYGLLNAIDVPAEPFAILIEPADKLLAREEEVLPNNWEAYGLELQVGGCLCEEDGHGWRREASQDNGLGM